MYLSLREVIKLTSLSKATIYRLMKNSLFPKQTKLSPRRVGWLESKIQQWIESLEN